MKILLLTSHGLVTFPVWKKRFRNIRFYKPMLLFLKQQESTALSQVCLMGKAIAKHETNDFAFSVQRVFLFPLFNWRKIKDQRAERRKFLDA